jgi:DNA invertase Pin-like site-specific DNA recombinase
VAAARKVRRAAIYARISLDRTGAGLGVERQVDDCIALASARGYVVEAIFKDNDVSAYGGRVRPDYRKLLAAMEAGAVDVVVAWHTDRLHRSPRELEEYIAVSEANHVDTVTVQAGELDLGTASGRMVARMLGAAARHESEQKSERIRRSRQQAAESGKSNGRLGYGYNADCSVNPEQAAVLREVSRRLLAGETLYSVTSDLNRRGIPSQRGRVGGWKSGNLRGTITRATLAGWREWRPGTSTTKGGYGLGVFLAKGTWTPILARDEVERLRALLFDPVRRTSRRPVENLLTGVLRCGICGLGLNGSGDNRNKSNPRRYRCIRQPGDAHCGRISLVAEAVEAIIEAAVIEVLTRSRFRTVSSGTGEIAAAEQELLAARKARDELAAERARGEITPAEWATMRRVLIERIDRAEHAVAVTGSGLTAIKNVPSGTGARKWWASATTAQKRVVIRALIKSVEIAPATNSLPQFDPSRVGEPVWIV